MAPWNGPNKNSYLNSYGVRKTFVCVDFAYCVQCASTPGTSCPTGTVRSTRSTAAMHSWTTTPSTTRWFALPARSPEFRARSRRSSTTTDGRMSCWSSTTSRRISAGWQRSPSTRFSPTTRITRSRGWGWPNVRQTDRSTTSFGKFDRAHEVSVTFLIGPIPWGHSGPLCHALSLSSSSSSLWTSHAVCAIAIAGVRLATPGDWQCNGGSQ